MTLTAELIKSNLYVQHRPKPFSGKCLQTFGLCCMSLIVILLKCTKSGKFIETRLIVLKRSTWKQYLMVLCFVFVFLSLAAKKPSDAASKPKKPPAPKAKKPDKSIWDSDSDTGSKKPAPALKGTVQIVFLN